MPCTPLPRKRESRLLMIYPAECAECGDRDMMVARCTLGGVLPTCNAPGSNHLHMICSRCGAEDVALFSAAEMADRANLN